MVTLICQVCSTEYEVIPARVGRSKYCSRKCANKIAGISGGKAGKGITRNKGNKRPDLGKRNAIRGFFRLSVGAKAPNWKGGMLSPNNLIRSRLELRLANWRKKVFERDDYTCALCMKRGGDLEAHHIKSFVSYPEGRLRLENGITLCKLCHNKTKGKEGLYEARFNLWIVACGPSPILHT